MRRRFLIFSTSLALACGPSSKVSRDAIKEATGDAGPDQEGDSGKKDSGATDAGLHSDAGSSDAGEPREDAGSTERDDAGPPDSGFAIMDAGADAGEHDAGWPDGGHQGCTSNSECPGSTPFCELANGLCVQECGNVSDDPCPSGQTCYEVVKLNGSPQQSFCVASEPCSSQSDCTDPSRPWCGNTGQCIAVAQDPLSPFAPGYCKQDYDPPCTYLPDPNTDYCVPVLVSDAGVQTLCPPGGAPAGEECTTSCWYPVAPDSSDAGVIENDAGLSEDAGLSDAGQCTVVAVGLGSACGNICADVGGTWCDAAGDCCR